MSELIERLLAEETDLTDCAADRIEQLERERDGIREVALREAAGLARILGVHPQLNTFGGGPEWHQHGKRIAYAIEALIGEPK